jgi:hypothetical protein
VLAAQSLALERLPDATSSPSISNASVAVDARSYRSRLVAVGASSSSTCARSLSAVCAT